MRKVISAGGSWYGRLVLGVPIRDLTAGFIGWNRRVLETIRLDRVQSAGFAFQMEMKVRAIRKGFRVEELPIIFVDRRVGASKMSGGILIEGLFRVWQVRAVVRAEEREGR
jgi:dolichol-phosphate mannosyltransferase